MVDSILERDIEIEPASDVDPFGRIFYYKNEVYRGVASESAALCKEILPHFENWEKYGLVKTRVTPLSLPGRPIILWHERIEYRNYCSEWLPVMFRDAAMKFLRMNLRLLDDGYICKDGHPWNIFFKFTTPVYIDIGSIVPYSDETFRWTIKEFSLYFLLPLILFEKRGYEAAYSFLKRPIPNHEERETLALTFGDVLLPEQMPDWTRPAEVLRELASRVGSLGLGPLDATLWSDYDQKELPIENPREFFPKQAAVHDFLSKSSPGSVLDIGCNKGWFSRLAEKLGHRVVAIDKDVPSITRLYQEAVERDLSILTLFVDFSKPSASHGLNNAYPAFEDRFSFDIVVAMAMIHHLVYSDKMTFEDISKRIARMCKSKAVVEFIPKEDFHVSQWDHTGREWYTRENFLNAFLRYFNEYRVVPSSPSPREVFLFTK